MDSWKLNLRRSVWTLLKIAGLLLGLAYAVYWVRFSPTTVVAHEVEQGTIVGEVMGTGTLEARVEASISPKIPGRIEQILVDQGDRVTAGDPLMQLDNEEQEQQVAIAQANREAAATAIIRLGADKQRASAIFDRAQKGFDQSRSLVSQNAVSQDDLDTATESLAIATADISRAEAAILEGQQELVAAEKTLEYHRARLRETVVHAPFDGLITKRAREPGDIVVPGSPVLTLIATDVLWIRAWVDETQMSRLEPGQPARVQFRSDPEQPCPGTVIRLSQEADRETREFVVDVQVLKLPKNWAVGQRAEVSIETAQKESVVTLPVHWLQRHEGELGVFIDAGETAAWRPVTLGLRSQDAVEVLTGLEAGESVIMPKRPKTLLQDGQRIVAR